MMKKNAVYFLFLLMTLVAACQPKPQVQWENYTPEVLEDARRSGKPVILYFSAAWCPGCYMMKETTFSDPQVIQALAGFRRIKADLSFKHSPKVIETGRKFQVAGLPMLLFFDAQGNPAEEFRIFGYLEAAQMLHGLKVFSERHPFQVPEPAPVAGNATAAVPEKK